ncbi:hypothetical protein HZH66_015454 [Vespula vulgaris]|uniref:Uncharacterized protein n=1 Tax=Vespula vulgaris TaxID=7454 RepID=A0A834IYL0_VESVU|nr:hypothetical protein HZH66_015454 [Vespula vulgaris]
MFQLFSLDMTKTEGLTNICYIIACIVVIYVYFYLGQKLIDHSVDVFIAFCQIPFYLLSLKTQKMLLILIMNSMRICNLSVVGVKEISHDMFASIYTLIMSEKKLKSIAKLLEMILPILCFGSCYYNLLSNGAIMRNILHRIKCDWNDLANKPELVILKKYAHLSRLCTVIIASTVKLTWTRYYCFNV